MTLTYDLYDQNDVAQNKSKHRIFLVWYFLLLSAVLAASIVGLILRMQAATMIVTIVGGALLILLWDWAGSPVNRYYRFLKDLNVGLRHENDGVFSGWGDITTRDGIYFHEINVTCGDEERVYYLDARKERPPLEEGASITLITHNKSAIIIRTESRLAEPSPGIV